MQTQTAAASQLPLSGRGAQNGSVTASQAAIPGVTSSVNTLNSMVQTQGPFAGSASGVKQPFSGKLSFREALDRGLAFNLGEVGLDDAIRQSRGQATAIRDPQSPISNAALSETVQQKISVPWEYALTHPSRAAGSPRLSVVLTISIYGPG